MRHGPTVNEHAIANGEALWKIIDARGARCSHSLCRRLRRCTINPVLYLTHSPSRLPPGACPLTDLGEYQILKLCLYHKVLKQLYENEDRAAREKEVSAAEAAGEPEPAARPRRRSRRPRRSGSESS